MTDDNDRFAKALEDIKASFESISESALVVQEEFQKLGRVMRDSESRGIVFLSALRVGKSWYTEALQEIRDKRYCRELQVLAEAGAAMYPGKEIDTQVFDEWSRFLSKPITKAELGQVVNPKNKPYYRQFEGGKKWKF